MYEQHSSPNTKQRVSLLPQQSKPEIQHKEVENEEGGHSSTQVKRKRTSANYFNDTPTPVYHTPTKRHAHPPGWDKITWAPKVCRKPVRRMDFGEIATAAH
uniref:Uncharacterized protein n=1 Tax=Panagrolaimus davidi TaxID=227884 RepID=A0A914QXG6_9BILA